MNNERGAELLAALKPGDLVTIRDTDGGQRIGRAARHPDGLFIMAGAHGGKLYKVTSSNILKVQPRAV